MTNNDEQNVNLRDNIEKKMKTVMIYPISMFEQYFGTLWGLGKKYEDLTVNEKAFRDIWDDCRDEILDSGNRQIRNAKSEIKLYKVVKTGIKEG